MDLNCQIGQPRDFAICTPRTAEAYAQIALRLEPTGAFWARGITTIKAAIYRAFGGLLSAFDARVCALFNESLACGSTELLSEWESHFGLPLPCVDSYPTDIAGRQAMVCAAKQSIGISTLDQLQALLKNALSCEYLTLQSFITHSGVGGGVGQPLSVYGGICVGGIGPADLPTTIHNMMGGWGNLGGLSSPNGSSVGQPLTIIDPSFVNTPDCPIIYHSTVGGWTGGVGQPLQYADSIKFGLLVCLMNKHLPAHISWTICE